MRGRSGGFGWYSDGCLVLVIITINGYYPHSSSFLTSLFFFLSTILEWLYFGSRHLRWRRAAIDLMWSEVCVRGRRVHVCARNACALRWSYAVRFTRYFVGSTFAPSWFVCISHSDIYDVIVNRRRMRLLVLILMSLHYRRLRLLALNGTGKVFCDVNFFFLQDFTPTCWNGFVFMESKRILKLEM